MFKRCQGHESQGWLLNSHKLKTWKLDTEHDSKSCLFSIKDMFGRTGDAWIGSKNLMVALAYVPPTFIQETKIMASGHITSWQIDGEKVETVSDFIFGGHKITADGDCSPGCSLEGMMLKLKLQYFGRLMWRVDSLEKTQSRGYVWWYLPTECQGRIDRF